MDNTDKSKELLNKLYSGCATILDSLLNDSDSSQEFARIILIGAHGTGKSTLANALSEVLDSPVVESVAREFFKNWKYLEDCEMLNPTAGCMHTTEVKQNILCSMSRWDFMRWVDTNINCIMTRCPLDTIAYGFADPKVSDELMKTNLNMLKEDPKFCQAIEKSLFVYLPIEFKLEDDGVRPMDKMFQRKVDTYMRKLMYDFHITPLVVSGSVEERMEAVLMRWLVCH